MRPTQSVGRPGTPVIPATWSDAPRTIVGKTTTAGCTIRHPGGTKGAFNEATGTYPITPHPPHFTGTARVQVLNAEDRAQLVAEQDITTVGYRVVVPVTADQVEVEDVVTFTSVEDHGDAWLVDREMVVRSYATGSLAWERDLICTANLD